MIETKKIIINKTLLPLLFTLFGFGLVQSQNPRIDRDEIYIGDRIEYVYTLDIEAKDQLSERVFPTDSLEIISMRIDTLTKDGKEYFEIRYELTSFVEGLHSFYDKDSNLFEFEVIAYPIDTTKIEIKDIKANAREPITFREILPILLIVLGVIVLVLALYYYYKYWKKNRKLKIKDIFIKPKPALPPYELAIKALEDLRLKRLCEKGENKRYYSELSEILREYLGGRFGIHAIEMTTYEISEAILGIEEIGPNSRQELISILRESDLVKFAKHIPESYIDARVMEQAIAFLESSKPKQEEAKPEKEVDNA